MIIMLVVGANWLKNKGQSQEYIDSWVIMIWVRDYRGDPDLENQLIRRSSYIRGLSIPLLCIMIDGTRIGRTRTCSIRCECD